MDYTQLFAIAVPIEGDKYMRYIHINNTVSAFSSVESAQAWLDKIENNGVPGNKALVKRAQIVNYPQPSAWWMPSGATKAVQVGSAPLPEDGR